VTAAAQRHGRRGIVLGVLVIADPKNLKGAQAEVAHALQQVGLPVQLVCGIADDPKGAELLSGTWGGRLDKALLIRTAREIAGQLAGELVGPAPVPSRRPADPPPPPAPPALSPSAPHPQEAPPSAPYPPASEPQRTGPRHGAPRPGQPQMPLDGIRGR
jgi:hypothetical protein